ncbi:XRE family transcriptional regulator [Macrococcoides canis]|uniref:helix-turn-helix transcriptional regulator n=1 Tax=Macrococcoides canis TaxID=1855823 RepID=UPI001061E906|nr:helix-turn-helix transcriptional regulator [Macrococcus canis]TDM38041.1 XRE family transcriptional regulator [Macrococcus canis]
MNTLKSLRKKHNITQEQLADAVGLATTTISSYEIGHRNITISAAIALAKYFNVNWTIFFDDKVREMYDLNEKNNQASDQTRLA